MQIAIDGPASSGKSTVAKIVATKLGFIYVDTGAMYRVATVLTQKLGLDYSDEQGILAALKQADIQFKPDQAGQKVFLDNEDITLMIRTPEITNNVSQVSALAGVRTEMVARQRKIAAQGQVVMDGRDIGTTVLPTAEVKIFMVASAQERAKRRYAENTAKGIMTPLATLQAEIELRDQKDSTRVVSPLKKADDAIEIDTTQLTINEVVEAILVIVKQNM
ncbi:(d)CMP kinase [Latilactobacillus graminis]|uniref:Cytidylate kinase n=2 Tax=Latilactobacillus graminis TaxID=60519 RepID=A0AA89I1B9_9LACO|nr:(d)CMP kinase [Latilactobacillus graminis]KRM23786.1 cytidylate kinase [Latilactobacillus graminis DSM 20719]QFP79678.1 (d)CMP kinase [Latilactobacillus graminis]